LNEDLSTKPPAQASYRDLFATSLQPIEDIDRFQRFYYTVQRKADDQMWRVWEALKSHNATLENTYIVLTADHGELLQAHGRMIQKWYQGYQEALHVPLIICPGARLTHLHRAGAADIPPEGSPPDASPVAECPHPSPPAPQAVYHLSSHVDLLPTFLELADLPIEGTRKALSSRFSLAVPLPGRSLARWVDGGRHHHPPSCTEGQVYFYTQDDPTRGPHQVNALGQPYLPVSQPGAVEMVVAYLKDTSDPHRLAKTPYTRFTHHRLWKLTQYYNPYGTDVPSVPGPVNELYDLSTDPMELTNLYGEPDAQRVVEELTRRLKECRAKWRVSAGGQTFLS
jgi:arylsulfatase A-like enzyme